MYDIKALYEAHSVKEAVRLRVEHPEAQIIAGGSDVLVQIREGKRAGAELISIYLMDELRGISLDEAENIRIGSLTCFTSITNDPIIQRYINVLGEAVDQVGGPQVRNVGTIGGNICNGAVSADSVPTAFSLECSLRIFGPRGVRFSDMESFYLGPGKVDLRPGEILTHVIVPREKYEGYTGHYIKYAMRNAMDIATLSCSTVCRVDKNTNRLEDIRMTFGVAAGVPLRVRQTEAALRGKEISEALYEETARLVRSEINPRDSWRASRSFRLQIGGEIAARSLREAVKKA